ncbi:MAG: hypothetical protein PHO02_02930 [Candidatus Nanoarchaeia archaeon]|nr:hypothetical protein [Candidatus Nanoarchaeia archaeon]
MPFAEAVAVMPSQIDLCRNNKVYVENNLDETAEYVVYNNEERVFSFFLEPGKRRGVYITKEGDASIEEISPESTDVINSVDIEVRGCGNNFLTTAIKAVLIGLVATLFAGFAVFYFIARKKNGKRTTRA